MSQEVLNSQATAAKRQFYFFLMSSTTLGPLTGYSYSATDIQLSKNGASPANSAGSVTQISATAMPGVYYYTSTTGEIGSDGFVIITIAPAGAVARTYIVPVVEFDQFDGVHLGLTSLPNAAAAASGGLPTLGTGAGQIAVDGSTGATLSNVSKWNGTAVTTPINAGNPVVDVNHPTLTVGTGTNGMTTFSLSVTLSTVNQLKNQWVRWRAGAANYHGGLAESQQIASSDTASPSNVTMATPYTVSPVAGDVADLIGV